MASTKRRAYRRRRGTIPNAAQLGYVVKGANRDRFEDWADNIEMSASELFDLMVENTPLDAYGRPTWLPPRPIKDGVLPIDAA